MFLTGAVGICNFSSCGYDASTSLGYHYSICTAYMPSENRYCIIICAPVIPLFLRSYIPIREVTINYGLSIKECDIGELGISKCNMGNL